MNKKFIIEHNLMEAHKQFMRLSEGYLATSLEEAGEEDQNNPQGDMNPGQGQPPTDMPPMDGNTPPMDNQAPDMNAQAPQPGEGDMQGQPPMDMPPTDNNMPPMPDEEAELDDNVDDTVLDVEDLTQAQEKLNKKQNTLGKDLGEVDDRIIALLTAVEKIQGSLDKNNNDIQSLKAELEKRVPTQTEKLNMQSLKMYPYNVAPNEYWKDKETDGRYQAEGDEDNKKREFKLTEKDVNDYSDTEIEHSFDDELHQTMRDIFKDF